jgi:hypothetical protein
MKAGVLQPIAGRESLDQIAAVALEFGRLLLQAAGSARGVEEVTRHVAAGLGAEHVSLRGFSIARSHDGYRADSHAQSRCFEG